MKNRTIANRYLPLLVITLLNLVILLIFGSVVIYRSFLPIPDFVQVSVTPPPPVTPPPQPPMVSAGASASLSDPTPVEVPASSPPTVALTRMPTDFKLNLPKVLDHTRIGPSLNSPVLGSQAGGNGGKGGNNISFYGNSDSTTPGLIGEFYDLKQTPDRKPTPMAIVAPETNSISKGWQNLAATANGVKVLRHYIQSWDQTLLDNYYKAPIQLQAAQIFVPVVVSELATQSYKVADKVVAKRWIAHYHAKIVPPKEGTFRFLGFGDDFLMVRLNNSNVLDGSYPLSGVEDLDRGVNTPDDGIPGPANHHLYCGKWFHLDPSLPVPIDILIGEGPGGYSGFVLLIQEKGADVKKGDYSVFQVTPSPLPPNVLPPPFHGQTMVFGLQ